MGIPSDVTKYIARKFAAADRETATTLLQNATIHDDSPADPRLLRCAAVASGGSMEKLRSLIDLLKRDFRDVIVAGEYEQRGGQLVQVRDLNRPIKDKS